MKEDIENTKIVNLLQKYIQNRCTEEELVVLFNWLKSSDSNEGFDYVSQVIWTQIVERDTPQEEKDLNRLSEEVDLLLQKIQSEKQRPAKKRKLLQRTWLLRVAAVALLVITLGAAYLLNSSDQSSSTYKELITQIAIKEYKLPDGTQVILNSGSKLIVPDDFNKKDRLIEIEGEAFFDVAPNPQKPFIIKDGNVQIKVLGTSFNFKGYKEDDFVRLAVSSGKVLVSVSDLDLQLRVNPLEHLSINKTDGTLTKDLFEENHYVSWTKGLLYFDNEPIKEVVKMINRKYDKKVVLQCEDCKYMISGSHDNKSIEAVIESICFTTDLKSKTEGETIILYK